VIELEAAKSLVRSRPSRLELVFRFDRSLHSYLEFVQELASVVAEQGAELREMHAGVFRAVDPVSPVLSTDNVQIGVTVPVETADDLEKALAMVRSRSGSDPPVFQVHRGVENRRQFVDEIARCALQHRAGLEKIGFGLYRLVGDSAET